MKLPNHTTLKEWSTVIDALSRGEQVILIRKGGIADPKFGVEADRFYLYPTYFHQQKSEPAIMAADILCQDLRRKLTGQRPTDAYFRDAAKLADMILAGGFEELAEVPRQEIMMSYESR